MKVAVINFSGNVGKSTVANHLIAPNLPKDTAFYIIETINGDMPKHQDDNRVKLRGDKFNDVIRELMLEDTAVIDIGSSNVEKVLDVMKHIEGSFEDIDYFVVPVVPSEKEKDDTLNTLLTLLKMGISPEKIKIVFNQVEHLDEIDVEFEDFIHAFKRLKIKFNKEAAIKKSPFFPAYLKSSLQLEDLVKEETYTKWREELKQLNKKQAAQGLTDEEDLRRLVLVDDINLQRMAKSAVRNLDSAYQALFPKDKT